MPQGPEGPWSGPALCRSLWNAERVQHQNTYKVTTYTHKSMVKRIQRRAHCTTWCTNDSAIVWCQSRMKRTAMTYDLKRTNIYVRHSDIITMITSNKRRGLQASVLIDDGSRINAGFYRSRGSANGKSGPPGIPVLKTQNSPPPPKKKFPKIPVR